MSQNFSIVITGTTGYVGKNFRKFLAEKNIKTVCISRKNFKAYKSEKESIIPDFADKSLADSMQNCSTLVHLIGSGRQTVESDYNSINVDITKKVVKSCKRAKIKKIIYLSGLGVSESSTISYFISKFKAEKEIINSGINYTIFRPSYIIGNNDPLSKSLAKQMRDGKIIIPGSGNYNLQPIHIKNVVEILFQAVYSDKYNKKIFDLVGPKIEKYHKLVKKLSNDKVEIKKIPLGLAYYNAIHNKNWIFGVDDLNLLVGNFTGNFERLKKISKLDFIKI